MSLDTNSLELVMASENESNVNAAKKIKHQEIMVIVYYVHY